MRTEPGTALRRFPSVQSPPPPACLVGCPARLAKADLCVMFAQVREASRTKECGLRMADCGLCTMDSGRWTADCERAGLRYASGMIGDVGNDIAEDICLCQPVAVAVCAPLAFIPACSVSSPSFLSLSLSAFYSLVYAVPLFSFCYFRTICFVLLLDAVALCAQLSASAIF